MRWKYGGNGAWFALPPNIRVVEFDGLICGNAIRHRRDDDQPDMVVERYSKITGNTRTRARRYSVEYFRQGNRQEPRARTQDDHMTWRVMALTVAQQITNLDTD